MERNPFDDMRRIVQEVKNPRQLNALLEVFLKGLRDLRTRVTPDIPKK